MKVRNTLIISISFIIITCISTFANGEKIGEDYCLKRSYNYYITKFVSKDGRVMDPDRGDITTSEGQSYIMQRTVAVNDRKTFDRTYKWTKEHLQRRDKLFSWIWGQDKKGKFRVLDRNSAADADVNIAFALILAYERWKNEKYLKEALPIVDSIWRNETKKIGKLRVLMPGWVQTRVEKIEVNPSYFAPYAFKFFKKYDKKHDWNKITESSYYYILASSAKTKTGLPPNWFLIEKGEIVLENSERSDFSYDAIRVFKKIYWDYVRTGDKRDLPILAKSKFFINKWDIKKKGVSHLYTNWKADGTPRDLNEFIGSVAILILPISMYNQKDAIEIYKKKLEPYLINEDQWKVRRDYYGKNLLWFGCHFYFKNSSEYKEMGKLRKSIFEK